MAAPKLGLLLRVAGTVATIAVAFYVLDWRVLLSDVPALSLARLSLAVVLSLSITALLALRWAMLSAPAAAGPRVRAARDALAAGVFNLITPASIGGDAYRVMIARDRLGSRARAAGLVILERALGMINYSLLFLAAYAVVVAGPHIAAVFDAAALGIALLGGGIIAALAAGPVLSRGVATYAGGSRLAWVGAMAGAAGAAPPWRLAVTFGLSLLSSAAWLAYISVFAGGTQLTVPALTMVTVVSEFSRLLPISIQGVGVREATFAWLAGEAGGAPGPAYVACAAAYALHFALVAAAGFAAHFVGRRASGAIPASAESGRGN